MADMLIAWSTDTPAGADDKLVPTPTDQLKVGDEIVFEGGDYGNYYRGKIQEIVPQDDGSVIIQMDCCRPGFTFVFEKRDTTNVVKRGNAK